MSKEDNPPPIMECSCSYSLVDETGTILEKGESIVRLEEENFSILPKKCGDPLFISFRDTVEVFSESYKVSLLLTSKEKLTLSDLGYKYEDFVRVFLRLRNELILKDLLMHETLRKSGVKAEVTCGKENEKDEKDKGTCELRLYETALVVIPDDGELTRIPYSEITEIQDQDHVLTFLTDRRERWTFSKMGYDFDPFVNTFSDLMNELSLKVQSSLKELLPQINPSIIRRVARFMKEGKAARRKDIETVSPELWKELEKKLAVSGIKEEYDFLQSLAQKDKMCIGLKRGLLGDLTGEYIWFLIPIYSTNPDEPGNAMAMEAISDKGSGRATYFFRIVKRMEYKNISSIETLHSKVDELIEDMNRCMLAINFRREPIYLPSEKLEEPQYQKYKFAIAKISELQKLRELFIGRVIHSSSDQWKRDVLALLKFNIESLEDTAKWKAE
ncbi:hypothetical protein [Thermospira aquatica]|uniref:Uncharacterized protein n=1 Tax=Thermospira aquatica TaxID=2828656 RepID=A0AAX3BDJ8_9SPIR|nr:hypothetical protein [Thermospira aquatica]URA10339.1 hypothetical protein KDW03_00610 [Thermospira aquatica]